MSLTAEQTDILKSVLGSLLESGGQALADNLGMAFEAQPHDVVLNDELADVPDLLEGHDPILAFFPFDYGEKSHFSLLIKSAQARPIAAYMLGATPGEEDAPLTEMQLSATGEALNQLMNAGVASISSSFMEPLAVNSPEVLPFSGDALLACSGDYGEQAIYSVHFSFSFKQEGVSDTLDGVMLLPAAMVTEWISLYNPASGSETAPSSPPPEEDGQAASTGDSAPQVDMSAYEDLAKQVMANAQQGAGAGQAAGAGNSAGEDTVTRDPVTVQPVKFGSFDNQTQVVGEHYKNLDLLMDVRLNLTVELGRTKLSLKEVLELTRGSVVELNRIAGEAVDLLANGKLIARGEVVVIEDNFGLRITSIVSPHERLKTM